MAEVNYFKVTSLPAVPIPNAFYYLKQGNAFTFFLTDAVGAYTALTFDPAIIQEIVEDILADLNIETVKFIHDQSTPDVEWTINHNLGERPAVQVYDTGGNVFEAEVLHISVNQCKVYSTTPVAGIARCL